MTRRISPLGLPLSYHTDVSVSITGAESAGEAQAPASVITDVNYTLTGAEAPAQANTVTVTTTGNVNAEPAGAESAGEAATPASITGDANYTLTGAEAAAEAGAVTAGSVYVANVTGGATAGQAGLVDGYALADDFDLAPLSGARIKGQLGPLGITGPRRDISGKGDWTNGVAGDVFVIESGAVRCSTTSATNSMVRTGEVYGNDQWAEFVIKTMNQSAANRFGFFVRANDLTSNGVYLRVDHLAGNFVTAWVDWDGESVLDTPSPVAWPSLPATVRVEVTGTTYSAYLDGVLIGRVVNSTYSSGSPAIIATCGDTSQVEIESFRAGEAGYVSTEVNYTLAGAEASSDAGTVTVTTPDATVNITGAAAAADAGTATGNIPNADVIIAGAEAASQAGIATGSVPNVDVNITGAESVSQAGTIISSAPTRRARLSPLGLALLYKGDTEVSITGAESAGEAGTAIVADDVIIITGAKISGEAGNVTPTSDSSVKGQLGPLGLTGPRRNISPKSNPDIFVSITGAAIQGQQSHPDLADAIIYTDGSPSDAQAGISIVDDQASISAQPPGAEAGADAGTVTGTSLTSVGITGAEIQTQVGATQSIVGPPGSIAAAVAGAVSEGQVGTVTFALNWLQPVTGAEIGAEASPVGINTDAPVSVTITGAAANMLTSNVGFVNLYPVPVVGAEIQVQAHNISRGFGEIDLGLTNSTDRFNGLIAGLAVKAPCRTATLTNISLSGHQSINGLSLVTGDRVLVTAQTNSVDNGIYVVDSSDWERAADFDGNRDIVRGTLITVTEE